MKKIISAAMAAACVVPSQAENTQTKLDTTNVQNISEVVVKAVRAPQSAPFAITNVQKQQLQDFAKSGKERTYSGCALMERERRGNRYNIHASAWRCRQPHQRNY